MKKQATAKFWQICILFLVLILIPSTIAITVIETDIFGNKPQLYGDIIVFEHEDEIKIFNIKTDEIKAIAKGNNPAVFANTLVFQTQEKQINEDLNEDEDKEDIIIQYYDIKEETIYNTGLAGENPTIYSNIIAFSINEKDMTMSLNNDRDKEDDIIMFYNLETKKLTSTNAAGNYPSTGPDFIIFETQENQQGYDLNGDGDKEDTVIRTYQFETKGVENTHLAGQKPQNNEDIAVFESNKELVIYNAKSGEIIKTELKGVNPAKHKNIIVYVNAGKLYTYNLKTQTCAKLEIDGEQPSIFELGIVFADNKNNEIKILKSEDLDNDKVPDIIDNCKETKDINQTDIDQDCIGDVCDTKIDLSKRKKVNADTSSLGIIQQTGIEQQQQKETKTEKSNTKTIIIIILIIIALVFFLIYYFHPKQRKKRKKGFGF